VPAVKALIELGAEVEASGANGWTPLHSAAFGGRAEVVTTLVESGADIGASTLGGETPLQVSIRFGQHQVTRVLRELERAARTKKEAAAKMAAEAAEAATTEATQQAIDQAERMGALVIDRGGGARPGRSEEGARLLHSRSRRAPWHPVGWCVHRTRVKRIVTRSGDGARTTG
jgi:hypothetical protein